MNKKNTSLLRVEKVSKKFNKTQVLSDVSFSLGKGEILGLVGENGAGKSTLMNIIFGMTVIRQTGGYEGNIFFEDKKVNFAKPTEALDYGIGMIHQEFSLIPSFNGIENILLNRESLKDNFLVKIFGDSIKTLDYESMAQRAKASMAKLGVDIDIEMPVSEMPIGYRQFIEIARELDRKNIKLLVLDEPTAVLTESESQILLEAVKRLSETGISIIIISHRLQEIMDVADKIVVLRDGMVVSDNLTQETTIDQMAEEMIGRTVSEAITAKAANLVDDGQIALKIENLWTLMPGEEVHDVSLDIKKGEILGIGGLAGQGKLGLANGIMGYYKSGGRVYLNGKEIPLNSPRAVLDQSIAFVSEDRKGVGLLLEETIEWNMVFTAMQIQNKFLFKIAKGLFTWRDKAEITKIAKKYIDEFQIKCSSSKQLAGELSGGNQQKICLAKALIVNPSILFVSEPTRGIDIGAKKIVLDTLRRYNQEYGTTIVMVSSELNELRSISDRIAIVEKGKIAGILPKDAPYQEFGKLMAGVGV